MSIYESIGLISAIIGIVSFAWFLYEKRPIRRLRWRIAEKAAGKIVDEMAKDEYDPTVIFGIGRGGAIFGSMISGALGHCPLIVIDRKYRWSEKGRFEDMIFPVTVPPEYTKRVLLVAGEAHSGLTMNHYHEYLLSAGAQQLRRAVLFYEEGCTATVEYYGLKSANKKMLMPWMRTKHYIRADRSSNKPPGQVYKLRLYLVRHAETSAGEDVFAGSTDYDLTVEGIKQASSLGKCLCGLNITKIYVSPLGRAVKTAAILHNYVSNAEVERQGHLREIDFGVWEGLTRSKIQEKYGNSYTEWDADPVSAVPEGGEEPADVLERLLSYLTELEEAYRAAEGVELIAVTHKTCIRMLLSHFNHEPLHTYRNRKIANCEVYALVYDGNHWFVDDSNPGV